MSNNLHSIIIERPDDEAPQQARVAVTRVAGGKFRQGEGLRLYRALRNTMIPEAAEYAEQCVARGMGDYNRIFAEKMETLYAEWLRPLLLEAAGLR